MRKLCVLGAALLAVGTAPRTARAQWKPLPFLSASVGPGEVKGGSFVNPTVFLADGSLGGRVRYNRTVNLEGAIVGGFTTLSREDLADCRPKADGSGCVSPFPSLGYVGVSLGVGAQKGAFGVGVSMGPVVFHSAQQLVNGELTPTGRATTLEPPVTTAGLLTRAEASVDAGEHFAIVGGGFFRRVPSFRGGLLNINGFSIGLRVHLYPTQE